MALWMWLESSGWETTVVGEVVLGWLGRHIGMWPRPSSDGHVSMGNEQAYTAMAKIVMAKIVMAYLWSCWLDTALSNRRADLIA